MCHSHYPGDGIDLIKATTFPSELTLRLDRDDCHYVLSADDLYRVIEENPWKGAPGEQSPELSSDLSIYEPCHKKRGKAHEHRMPELWRFERQGNYLGDDIEVAVTYCNCHVQIPIQLVLLMFGLAFEHRGSFTLSGKGLAKWRKSYKLLKEGYDILEIG